MTTIQVPDKWAFGDSKADKISEAIGMDEERFNSMQCIAKDVAIRAVLTDKKINTNTKAYEVLLNDAAPKNMIEAFMLGVFYGNFEHQAEKLHETIFSALNK